MTPLETFKFVLEYGLAFLSAVLILGVLVAAVVWGIGQLFRIAKFS